MANNNTFNLYSNNFETIIKSSWRALQIEHDFCDVTLVCDEKSFEAHKVIISAGSPVLKNILKLNKSIHPLIYLRNVGYNDLENLLSFIYQGEINIFEKDVTSFLKVAQDLKINGLFSDSKDDAEVTNDDRRNKEKSTQLMSKDTPISSKQLDQETFDENGSELNNKDFSKAIKEENSFIDIIPGEKKYSTKLIDQNILISLKSKQHLDNQETENIDQHSSISGSSDESTSDISQLLALNYDNDAKVHQDMQFSCRKCNFKAKRKHYLDNHIETNHKGVRFSCELCDYESKQRGNLNVHIETNHNEVKYFCDRCDYEGKTKYQLKVHVQSKHEGSQYPCDECNYVAIQKEYLNRHRKRSHPSVLQKCTLCDNKYRRKDHLKMHVESIHKGVQYSCSQCDYKANQKPNLKTHIQKSHNAVPFSCDSCHYKTSLKSNLKEHIEVTHKMSSISCDTCDKQFSNTSNLLKHVVSLHKEESYHCDQCGFEAHLKQNLYSHIESKH